ncbi:MAG TPA: aminoacyl-tRNA hydrolase [Solirubrobacteraceae bacterium]|nr:aminoacyl-tRNA hydrolase [Solirubrobacteraceae bacterium]
MLRRLGGGGGAIDWLIVGLGNPGTEYAGTPHNIGFAVAEALVARWGLGRAKDRFRGRISEGRIGGPGIDGDAPRAPRVAVLCPQTYMNEAGRSVGPARGALKLALDRVLVVHDEIDLPFGDVRARVGGGLAGHNGLRSLRRELGSPDFTRVRVGVGRPDSTDPEIVSAYVLGRFRQDSEQVSELVQRACDEVERVVLAGGVAGVPGETGESR